MSRRYLRVTEKNRKYMIYCTCLYNGEKRNLKLLFDTGSMTTYIPATCLGYSMKDRVSNKRDAVVRYRLGKIHISHSKGVESGDMVLPAISSLSDEELLQDKYVCFSDTINEVVLGTYPIGNLDVRLSFDRGGTALLGIDVINRLLTVIGTSNDRNILLSVLKDQGDKSEFYKELENCFSLEPSGRDFARFLRGTRK